MYGQVNANFLGWVVYHIFLHMVLRFAREGSAINTYFGSKFSFYRSSSCRIALHAQLFDTVNVKYQQSK